MGIILQYIMISQQYTIVFLNNGPPILRNTHMIVILLQQHNIPRKIAMLDDHCSSANH